MTDEQKKEEVALAEVVEETAVATVDAGLLERLASNPDVDVDKLERMVTLMERGQDREAKAAYIAAFAKMQPLLPVIERRGKSHQSDYATHEDIQEQIKPILVDHGFALSYRTEFGDNGVKITAVLAHEAGHSEETSFIAEADDSGSKNSIQARGSTQKYGMRYATVALLNITTKGEDDDGNSAEAPEPPAGYEDWLLDLESISLEGTERLSAFWKDTNEHSKEYAAYLVKWNPQGWVKVKECAAKVGA